MELQSASTTVKGLPGGWQHSDVKIVSMACDVTALAAVKEAKRGSISKEGLYHIRTLTNMIREQCNELGCGVGAPQSLTLLSSSQVDHPSCAEFIPLDGWQSILESVSENFLESRAGNIVNIPVTLPCDMSERILSQEHQMTFDDYIGCLDRAVRRCDYLCSKAQAADTATPMYQICSFIEHLFSFVLPLPRGFSTPIVPRDWWCRGSVSLSGQRKGLYFMHQLALYYSFASFSLDSQDRSVASARAAVLFCILQSFDCLMRVLCDDEEKMSPLTLALAQRALSDKRPYRLSLNGFHSEGSFPRLFARMIFFIPNHLHLATSALNYLTHGMDIFENARLLNHMSLFDWTSDSERQITQFRVEASDPMIEFVTLLGKK